MANNPTTQNNTENALLNNSMPSDQSTLLQMLIQQNQMLTQMLMQKKQPKTTLNLDSKYEELPHFTNKELKAMPSLKDFTIRRKNGIYFELRYRRYGYDVSFSSKNFDEAKKRAFEWLRIFEAEIQEKKVTIKIVEKTVSPQATKTTVLFAPFADNYMENVKRKMVKENSYKSLYNTYKNHVRSVYGDYALQSITPQILQPHFNRLHEEKPRVCEDAKAIMSSIMEYAVNNGLINRNPMKAVFVAKHERTTGQALSKQEEKAFVQAIRGNYYEYSFLRMLYCGVRACEVNEIVENDDDTITIKNGKLKNYQKNYYRTVPMFPLYKENVRGKGYRVDVKKLSVAFTKFCPNHQLKDLRHTFTTRARECEIDNELVSLWTGHSLGNITASVYTHFSMEHQKAAAEKLLYEV